MFENKKQTKEIEELIKTNNELVTELERLPNSVTNLKVIKITPNNPYLNGEKADNDRPITYYKQDITREEGIAWRCGYEQSQRDMKPQMQSLEEEIEKLKEKVKIITEEKTRYQYKSDIFDDRLAEITDALKNDNKKVTEQLSSAEGTIEELKGALDEEIKKVEEEHEKAKEEINKIIKECIYGGFIIDETIYTKYGKVVGQTTKE